MIAASLSSLDARVLLLERRYLGIDGEPDDALGSLICGDASEKLEPSRIVLRIEDGVRTLLVTDHLILHEDDFTFVSAASQQLASAFALRANQPWLGAGVQLVEVAVIHSRVPLQIRYGTFDVRFHLELTEHIQSEILAAYRHFVTGRWEDQLRRVIE